MLERTFYYLEREDNMMDDKMLSEWVIYLENEVTECKLNLSEYGSDDDYRKGYYVGRLHEVQAIYKAWLELPVVSPEITYLVIVTVTDEDCYNHDYYALIRTSMKADNPEIYQVLADKTLQINNVSLEGKLLAEVSITQNIPEVRI